MKQLELKLYKRNSSEKPGELKETLVYIPAGEEYAKNVKLVITGEDMTDLSGGLSLPQGIDDTVLVEFGAKNVQTKLGRKGGK